MSITHCHINGELTSLSAAAIGVSDLALLRGYGVFDFFLFDKGQPRFLEDYLERFLRSAETLHLKLPVAKENLKDSVFEVIQANSETSGGIRLVLTGGYSADCYAPTEGNLLVLQSPFPKLSRELYEKGASVASHQYQREYPEAKSLNYITGIALLPWLKEVGANFPLYHDGEFYRESDRSNFFLVNQDDVLVTPAKKILMGITRAKVIQLARELEVKVEEREVGVAEVSDAREIFFTSSIKGLIPITKLDQKQVGDGFPGPITKKLQDAFATLLG